MGNKKIAPWIVVTELDGAGANELINRLKKFLPSETFSFHIPYSNFVLPVLEISGKGEAFGDPHTDRLAFILDARVTNYEIKKWRKKYQYILSKRGWADNFYHAAVQGFTYQETEKLLKIRDLEQPSAIIYLVCNPDKAFETIQKNDTFKDKFEIPEYLRKQNDEIVKFYNNVKEKNPVLSYFWKIPSLLIDTTNLSPEEVFIKSKAFLSEYNL